jgi:hypothetical protein
MIAVQNAEAASIGLETNPGSFGDLAYTILWRTTPLTWIGMLLCVPLYFTRNRERPITPAQIVSLTIGIWDCPLY